MKCAYAACTRQHVQTHAYELKEWIVEMSFSLMIVTESVIKTADVKSFPR